MNERRTIIGWTLLLIVLAGVVFLLLWIRRDEQQTTTGNQTARQAAEAPGAAPKIEARANGEHKPQAPAVSAEIKAAGEPLVALVLFDFDQSALRRSETFKLDQLADKIKDSAFDRLEVVGHADRINTNAYNLKISERRAEAVKAYLVGKGIDPGAVRTHARGEAEAVTGDACKNMGPETRENRKLVECLRPDRRAAIAVIGRQ